MWWTEDLLCVCDREGERKRGGGGGRAEFYSSACMFTILFVLAVSFFSLLLCRSLTKICITRCQTANSAVALMSPDKKEGEREREESESTSTQSRLF